MPDLYGQPDGYARAYLSAIEERKVVRSVYQAAAGTPLEERMRLWGIAPQTDGSGSRLASQFEPPSAAAAAIYTPATSSALRAPSIFTRMPPPLYRPQEAAAASGVYQGRRLFYPEARTARAREYVDLDAEEALEYAQRRAAHPQPQKKK